jgi:hypothetical protein
MIRQAFIPPPSRLPTADRRTLRVGAVQYLNTRPLVHGWEGPASSFRMTSPAGWPTGWRQGSSTSP